MGAALEAAGAGVSDAAMAVPAPHASKAAATAAMTGVRALIMIESFLR